jgi:hypothetical protein
MYVNTKMIPVRLLGNQGRRSIGGVEGVNSNMIYLIHCKNLLKCKCHDLLPSSTTKKEKKHIKIKNL